MIELDEEDIEFDPSLLYNSADPDKSHKLYYAMIKIMKDNLPNDKKVRRYIYDEKNLFLNRGKSIGKNGVRKSDGRMTYISGYLDEAFQITANWLRSGANPFELYEAFREKNQEKGYSHQNNEDSGSIDEDISTPEE